LLGEKLTCEVFANWRKGQINERLRTTLALLEKVTLEPDSITAGDLAALRTAGVTDRAILDATYVCVGFNIIARIADALGFEIPSEEAFSRAARLLVIFGYKRLSGFWTRGVYTRTADLALILKSVVIKQAIADPHHRRLSRVQNAVLNGPATLPAALRQTISEGHELPGPLGAYAKKVAEQAYLITDEDIAELQQANYTDDQIFEATVSAALGAGLARLDCVLRALRSEEAATIVAAESSFEETCTPAMTRA
jgi:alkylhydroperoxidase family enzyme